jgi:hypothetical protein
VFSVQNVHPNTSDLLMNYVDQMQPVHMAAVNIIAARSIRQTIGTTMNDIDKLFAEELRNFVDSIEWLIATTECDDYIAKCTIERIKSSEFWREEEYSNDCC